MQEATRIRVGLETHKDSITAATAEPGQLPGRVVGKVMHDLAKLLETLAKVGPTEQLLVVYEAGPTGHRLQRALQAKGYSHEVISPPQMPKRPAASRLKTDGRDSLELAQCSRARQLRAVWIPEPAR